MTSVRTGLVGAWYGVIWIGNPSVEFPPPDAGEIVQPRPPDGFYVYTGTREGLVQVTLALGDAASDEAWSDEANIELELASVDFAAVSIGGDEEDLDLELPAPGGYRVRVRRRNRVEPDEDLEYPEEAYIIELQQIR